jgi:hypothetical protein
VHFNSTESKDKRLGHAERTCSAYYKMGTVYLIETEVLFPQLSKLSRESTRLSEYMKNIPKIYTKHSIDNRGDKVHSITGYAHW